MYESPIDVIYSDMVTKLEDGVLKAVQDVGITVDKQELLKALQYDRDSYRKGFQDGARNENELWMLKLRNVLDAMKEVEDDK